MWGVTVVDGFGRSGPVDLCLAEGVVAAIVEVGTEVPDGVEDRRGGFVVPGLVDSHVHLAHAGTTELVGDMMDYNLRATLAAGVTFVVDVGGPTSIFALRDRLAADPGVPSPRIFATGPFLTAAGSHPCESLPDPDLCVFVDAESAAALAEDLRARGADGLKVAVADAAFTPWGATPRLDLAALDAIAAVGLPVFAHVDTDEDVLDALAHGADILAHPPFAGPIGAEALAAAAGADAVHTTVSAFAMVGDLIDGSFAVDDPDLLIAEAVAANWSSVRDDPGQLLDGWVEESAGWAAGARENLSALLAAGAVVVPGSDAGYWFVPHGWALHRELRELEALGVPTIEILRMATWDARQALGQRGGRVAVGEPADLLLLSSDPEANLAALESPEQIWLAGVPWHRSELLTVDRLPDGIAAEGAPCLAPADCASGACDALSHACAAACAPPGVDVNDCGPDAWCRSASATSSDETGVCRDEPPCDLYAQDCTPGVYGMACLPYDADNNGCWFGGPRTVGERCSPASAATSCVPGLHCSPIDARCYRLCDPDGDKVCEGFTRCEVVETSEGTSWFGLCL